MKKLIIFLWLSAINATAFAQIVLTPTVMSPAGDYYYSGGTSLSFTVAEMTAVETITTGNYSLGQGFQNAYWIPLFLPVEENGKKMLTVSLYPNPCSESLHIKTGDYKDRLYVKLYDASGKMVLNKTIDPTNTYTWKFSIAALSTGIYSVTVYGSENQDQFVYKSKITIIHNF